MAVEKSDVKALHLSDKVVTDVNDLVTLKDGGVISGNVTLHQADLHILSGNFIQTASEIGTKVFNWSSKNAFIQAEEAFKGNGDSYGIACAGCVGYVILSVDADNNGLKLDGDLAALTSNEAALNAAWSFALDESSGASCLYIDHVDAPYVYFTSMPVVLKKLSTLTEEECRQIAERDDNGIYCPAYPDVGLSTLKTFYAQHSEGGSTKAFGKYAHAEGRGTTADCRYAHAEGSETYAGGIGSHAEGFYSMAMGWGSHAEGKTSLANKDMAHAEGQFTYSAGFASHAEGSHTSSVADATHSEGYITLAAGAYSHAGGRGTVARGSSSFAHGAACSAYAVQSFAIGNATSAAGQNSVAEGTNTKAIGNMSHAFGHECSAIGEDSLASGLRSMISGHCSYGHGLSVQTNANRAIALGINANADKYESYVWSAENATFYDTADGKYHAKGDGTYCINPANYISGFYIGSTSLDQIIKNAFKVYINAALAEFNSKSLTGTVELADVVYTLNKLYAIANNA